MKEVKSPKKPLIYYYCVVMLVLMLFNFFAMPWLIRSRVREVDYGTFMTMTENNEIGLVDVQSNQILFTDREQTSVYKTGVMNDPGLVDRLHASDAVFSGEIVEQMSPLANIFLTWVLPLLVFFGIGQLLSKRMMDKAGGDRPSMMFNMGKSNAKVYVNSSDGIKFSDVAGEDEAMRILGDPS